MRKRQKKCHCCYKRRATEGHHFWHPKKRYKRSEKRKVCRKCHKEYHHFFDTVCRGFKDCRDCLYATICCYWRYPKEVRAMQYEIKEGSMDMTFGSCCQHIKHTCPYCHSHHTEDIAFSKHSSHGIFQCPNCLKFYYIEECDQHSATV